MATSYKTPLAGVRFGAAGWARLPSGRWVSRLPPLDANEPGLFAIVDYQTALDVAKRDKVRLIRPDTLVELNQHGFRIEPVILPDAAQRAASPRQPGETSAAYENRLRANMTSLEWVRRHAEGVWAELSAGGWDFTLPVANAGKPWVDGAPPNKARLMGWSTSAASDGLGANDFGDWHQPLQVAHARNYCDYSSLAAFECDEEPTWIATTDEPLPHAATPADPAAAFPESAVSNALGQLGTKELTGHNDGEAIAKYFTGATRRGADGVERRTGWQSGWDWCAAFYGWCGGKGWRIAVREYVEDARKAGTWRLRDSGYAPKRGDGVVLARDGQDPTKGGIGHICRIETAPDANGDYQTIGGNESNTVKLTRRTLSDPELRGFIEN